MRFVRVKKEREMPHDYDTKTKRFVGVSRLAVRAEINKLTDHVAKEAAKIATRLQKKTISLIEFEIQMRDLLRSAHIIAASVGKGGRERMTQADWRRVGAKIKWQNGYLQKFARKIGRGSVSEIATASRAKSYASSIFVSFSNTFQKAQMEFVKGGSNPMQCRLITNSEEGCEECAADEAQGWISVDDMGEIGSRICGDFCKCDIEFEDELNASDLTFDVKVTVSE